MHPIDNIQWLEADSLQSNDYNPNVVYNQELKLLKLSLLKQGWIQPLLVDQDGVIIDGFHRFSLAKNDPEVRAMTNGLAPCAVLNLSAAERMMLTVRINRAKGSHIAVKMHELVRTLVEVYALSIAEVCEGIGATKDEVELLLMENVFKKLDVQNHKYSKAWYPA